MKTGPKTVRRKDVRRRPNARLPRRAHAGPLPLEAVPHLEFKQLARYAVGCIRTGDSAPYANCLVVGG